MAEASKPVLQKPPGFKDQNGQIPMAVKPQIRKQPLPPSFRRERKRCGFCRCCCCLLCIFLLLFIILITAAGALFYLWFHPKLPVYRLESIHFSHFNVSVTSDGTYLDSQTAVRMTVENPNSKKITFYYSQSVVGMTVDDNVDLGSASVAGFTQVMQNITVLRFTTQVKHALINDGEGSKLKDQFRSKNVVVSVEVQSRLGVGVEKWKLGKVPMDVLCKDVMLNQLKRDISPKCTVNLLKWINVG